MLLRKDFRKDAVLAGIVMLCVIGLLLTVFPLDSEAHPLTEERTVTSEETTIKKEWKHVPNEDGVLEYRYVEVSRTTTIKTSTYIADVTHDHPKSLWEKIADTATSAWNAVTGGGGGSGGSGGNP